MVYHVLPHREEGTVDWMVLLLWLQWCVEVEIVVILVQWVASKKWLTFVWCGEGGSARGPFPKTPERKSNVEDMEDMVSQARTLAMKRMIGKILIASTLKKACTVQTALAKDDETYVSIVKDLLQTKP
jgi:hypothetical protein